MFYSSMKLFTMAASNSLIAFCLCNLIIVILHLSVSKPSSPGTQESFISTHEAPKTVHEKEEKGGHEASLSADVPQVENTEKSPVDNIEESDNDDEYKEEEEDDDELRRRVEEFIDKISRRWKAEKLMTSHLSRNSVIF